MEVIVMLIIIAIAFFLYTIYENKNLEVVYYTVQSNKLPKEFDNTRFVVISDLHNNTYGKDNAKLINIIKGHNPDFILVAGDMIVSKDPENYKTAYSILSRLAKEFPIYYGIGNHEQRVMPEGKFYTKTYENYQNSLEKEGVRFLINETIEIKKNNASLAITGLVISYDYFEKFRIPKMKSDYIKNLVGNPNKKCYNILIAHNPMYYDRYKEWGANLTISGHLHGGIVRLPGLGGIISPQYKLFPKYDSGRFDIEDKTLLVSRGLGMHTIKIRFNNRPELMIVTLQANH